VLIHKRIAYSPLRQSWTDRFLVDYPHTETVQIETDQITTAQIKPTILSIWACSLPFVHMDVHLLRHQSQTCFDRYRRAGTQVPRLYQWWSRKKSVHGLFTLRKAKSV